MESVKALRSLFILSVFQICLFAGAEERYLLYDYNPGEGFNLRRDVYIRIANLVKYLNTKQDWTLVLPPWGGIGYHWRDQNFDQSRIPWSKFFDVKSLNVHTKVIEYEEYIELMGEPVIEEVWYLQGYAEGIDFDNFVDKADERPCIDAPVYQSDDEGKYRGWFWGYEETYAKNFKCVSVQGYAKTIAEPLIEKNTTAKSVMIDRAENLLHDMYGGKDYWDARRSMVFSKQLVKVAEEFRKTHLDSDDGKDKTTMSDNWTENRKKNGDALGGPYIAAHLRRKDFLYARENDVPGLEKVARVLKDLCSEYQVDKVFIATDGTEEDMQKLQKLLPNMVRFKPTSEQNKKYKKGGVAIIDQIICSHARYFIGTHESTFTFRITEEREIFGFPVKTTYNRFCGEDVEKCDQITHWKIVWDDDKELWR